jgi:hypothetical protein
MKKDNGTRVIIAVIVLLLVCGAAAYLFVPEDIGLQQQVSSESSQSPSPISTENAVSQVKAGLPETQKEVASATETMQNNSTINSDDELANVVPEQENPYFNHEVKARLAQVANSYAEQIKYPSFSIPIKNQESLQKYLPNRSFTAERRLNIEDENSPSIHLQTDKHRYFSGEDIHVAVSVTGLTGDPWVKVQTRLVGEGLTLVMPDARASGQEASTYHVIFSGIDELTDSGIEEYRVVAMVTIDGQVYELGTPVSYVANVAKVTDVGMSQVRGEYLYIPVNVTTSKPGYHELSANLYSVQSGKPLVHLSVQQELQSKHGLMQLKAHKAALEVGGDPGPYRLKDISFTRMPSSPNFTTEYGSASQDSYAINGYAIDEYDDVPYEDEETQQRLDFLNQVGNVN